MVDEVAEHFGRLDILVDAIGGQRKKKPASVTEANFDYVIGANLKTAMFQAQAAARHMIQSGRWRQAGLLRIGAQSARACADADSRPTARRRADSPCCANSSRPSGREHRINVNVLAPTFTRTPQAERWLDDPEFYRNLVARIPMGRIAETGDIVGAVLFFVSPASNFITGQTLYLDGGITATQ